MERQSYNQTQLRKYKLFATGLLLLMAAIYVACVVVNPPSPWVGYVKAFTEAAMVGALADWFAVTALFRKPMGLPIPHTNIIENSKQRIGNNLGMFVEQNFLTAEILKPRVQNIKIATVLTQWLGEEKNRKRIIKEILPEVEQIIFSIKKDQVVPILAEEVLKLKNQFNLPEVLHKGLTGFIDSGQHKPIISMIAKNLGTYVANNDHLIKDLVSKESSSLIPKFVDDIIAEKILKSILMLLGRLAYSPDDEIHGKVQERLIVMVSELPQSKEWQEAIAQLESQYLSQQKIESLVEKIWLYVQLNILNDLKSEHSKIGNYIEGILLKISTDLNDNSEKRNNLDLWAQKLIYKLVLKYKSQAGTLISQTVGNWEARDLSNKLELEVGKDLQFIRVNGTLVGGLVGLLIYILTSLLK